MTLALLPLAGLAALALRRWRGWRALPPALREEWTWGRLVPAQGGPAVLPPVRFTQGDRWIEMRGDGVVASRTSLLGLQGVPRLLEASWVADQAGQLFVPWAEVVEWAVETDSDGPEFYRLVLRQGDVRLRRLSPAQGPECGVLDAVRRAALTCYAVEGAYPQSLEELERGYGLAYNKDAYIVSYDAFASNIMPNIQVLRKGETQP